MSFLYCNWFQKRFWCFITCKSPLLSYFNKLISIFFVCLVIYFILIFMFSKILYLNIVVYFYQKLIDFFLQNFITFQNVNLILFKYIKINLDVMTQQKSLSPAYNKIQRRHGGSLSSAHSFSSSHSLKLPTITEVRANGHIHDRHLLKPDHSARSLALRYSRNSLSPLLSSHSSFSANYKGLNGR